MDKKKNILYIVLPIVAAIIVLSAFAVSGNITKKADEKNPTAQTQVSAVNEKSTVTEKNENAKVTLLATGDNLIHNTLISAGEQSDGTLNYDSLYANIKPEIEKFDISVIDQETVLGA